MTTHIRFMQNNMAAAEGATISVSSALAGFPASNSVAQQRWKRWMPSGSFRITSSNKKIYINDGSDKTITLTEAVYATGALMAAHVVTQLNASSSNWSGSYSLVTGKFTFGRSSGTALFRLSVTTDATWDTLGYVGVIDDDVGVGQAADVRRNHTSERWAVDLGVAKNAKALIVIGQNDTPFTISDSSTCVLKGSAVNDYDTATFTQALEVEATGIFQFFDETLRYFWLDINDRENEGGPQAIALKIYLGDYITPVLTNLNLGFSKELVDPSQLQEADSGVLFGRLKSKYWRFASLQIDWMSDEDRTELQRCFEELGIVAPFYVSIDPAGEISDSVGEMTKYVRFDGNPSFDHRRHIYYGWQCAMREEIG